jgi:hypothetical protein
LCLRDAAALHSYTGADEYHDTAEAWKSFFFDSEMNPVISNHSRLVSTPVAAE